MLMSLFVISIVMSEVIVRGDFYYIHFESNLFESEIICSVISLKLGH